MGRGEVIGRLVLVMRDSFDDDDLVYRDDLTAADVAEWDSLSNIAFMVAVEQAFGTRFSGTEMSGLAKLGDLVDLLVERS